MKYSGLNPQEQWELLNPSTSLNTLASYNAQKADAINKAVNSSAIRNSGTFGLNFELNRNSQNPSNPSKLPSLQGRDSDARMRCTNAIEELAAQILGRDRLAPTPSPYATPLPQPGPRIPTQTPKPISEPTPYKSPDAKPLPYPPGVVPTIETYKWYDSYDRAAEAWAKENVNLSKDLERCAMIYKNIDKNGNERYTFTKSYYGMDEIPFLGIRPNVVIPFAWLRYLAPGIPESDIVGFIHSHPEPPENASYRNASDEDLSLNKYGIDNVTVVPYETGVPRTYNLPNID